MSGKRVSVTELVNFISSVHALMNSSQSLSTDSNEVLASGMGIPTSEGIGDVHPSLEDKELMNVNSKLGNRRRRTSRYSRYLSASRPTRSSCLVSLAVQPNTPSSCARASAEFRTIHDIRSNLFVGSTTSSRQLEETGMSSADGGSRMSGLVIIKSESQPSVSGGNCKARGCHSDISKSASTLPIVRVFALEIFSWPSVMRSKRCWQCCHNRW